MRLAIILAVLVCAACSPGEPESTPTTQSTLAVTAPLTSAAPDPAATGDYTDDQVESINVYAAVLIAYCSDPETGPSAREWATPDNIIAQVWDEYGFVITRETAQALVDAC